MKIGETFPLQLLLSLAGREDRRHQFFGLARAQGFRPTWKRAIAAAQIRGGARGFATLGKYACALGKRLMILEAERQRAPSVLMFEDDATFAPDFVPRIAGLRLPEDWGIFYFGCTHLQEPEPVAPGLVRVRCALDAHAWAVRAPYYRTVLAALTDARRMPPGEPAASDVLVSQLHATVPTYAAFPNLAWQAVSRSDLAGGVYSNYEPNGRQKLFRHVVASVTGEALTVAGEG
ncbi:hypothetical protein ACXR0O_19250 [Verrucomicrobiota bacterium sgz303538]